MLELKLEKKTDPAITLYISESIKDKRLIFGNQFLTFDIVILLLQFQVCYFKVQCEYRHFKNTGVIEVFWNI